MDEPLLPVPIGTLAGLGSIDLREHDSSRWLGTSRGSAQMSQSIYNSASTDPAPSAPFANWQRAVAALDAAEARSQPHELAVLLAVDVIRTRIELTLDRMRAGWDPPEVIVLQLIADQYLLAQSHD